MLEQSALTIIKTLSQAGHIAYFAGGWVRDQILGQPSDDIDIATSATVEEIIQLFPKTIPVGITFGIVIVVIGSDSFEVATFREDQQYIDGRRPLGFHAASAQIDAQRRDFTINGLFYDPLTHKTLDFVGGISDLKQGIIRCIGNPVLRLNEDKLRMIRAVRYSVRFNFPIDVATQEAIIQQSSTLLPAVATERLWQELMKMDACSTLDVALVRLHELHLLQQIFPTLRLVSKEKIQSQVKIIPLLPSKTPLMIKLLELFEEHSLQEAVALCQYLKLPGQDQAFVKLYFSSKPLLTSLISSGEIDLVTLAYFYADPRADLILAIYAAHLSKTDQEIFSQQSAFFRNQLGLSIQRIVNKDLFVKAKDLQDYGIYPGKEMGVILKKAEKLSITHPHLTQKEVIVRAIEHN